MYLFVSKRTEVNIFSDVNASPTYKITISDHNLSHHTLSVLNCWFFWPLDNALLKTFFYFDIKV